MQIRIRTGLIALLASGLALFPTTMASANDDPPPPETQQVADHLIIDGQRVDVAVMDDFVASGAVVISDGTSVETGRVEANGSITTDRAAGREQSREALAGCGWTSWVAPAGGNYIQSVPGCSLIGTTSSATAGYLVTTDSNTLAGACVQVLGYHLTPVSGGAGYQYTGFWTGIGCLPAAGGSGGGTVPWGNVAASKRILVASTGGIVGSSGMFS